MFEIFKTSKNNIFSDLLEIDFFPTRNSNKSQIPYWIPCTLYHRYIERNSKKLTTLAMASIGVPNSKVAPVEENSV